MDIFTYAQEKLRSQVVAAVVARWAEYREIPDDQAVGFIDRLASPEWEEERMSMIEESYDWIEGLETVCGAVITDPKDLCDCGHRIDQHQTGEGAWAGFCYADTTNCDCEQPTKDGVAQDASL